MPRLIPLKIDRLASVMMNAEMPVAEMSRPLARPAATPRASAADAASKGGSPQICIIPANAIAARPPIAPMARFIWPMPTMIICDIAMTQFTATASIRIWMLNGDRNEGSNRLTTIDASTIMASGPNQSVRTRRDTTAFIGSDSPSGEERTPRQIHQHGKQQEKAEPALHPEFADAELEQAVGQFADQRCAQKRAEY